MLYKFIFQDKYGSFIIQGKTNKILNVNMRE